MATIDDRAGTVDFDHHSAAYADQWPAMFADLRERCPVAYTHHHGGFWIPSRYTDIVRISRDTEVFTSDHDLLRQREGYQGVTIPEAPIVQVPIELDGPEFQAYRKLLNPKFSPSEARRWDAFLADATDACLNRVCESGSMDVVLDLANPVPALMTLRFLGMPLEAWERCATPFHEIAYQPPGTEGFNAAVLGILWVLERAREVFEERRKEPADDFLSYLATATIDGSPVPDSRVMEIITLTFVGGVDTTTALLANTVIWLDEHPEQRQRLIDEPDLMQPATEEFLRYFSPSNTLARTVTQDVDVGGRRLRAGDRVLLPWCAANRDPEAFERPEEVVLDRNPNRHTAFGVGVHRCLGSNFARRVFRAMLTGLLRRMPDISVNGGAARRYTSVGNVNGWIEVPATFTPTDRVETALSL